MKNKVIIFLVVLVSIAACKSNEETSKANLGDRNNLESIAITETKYDSIKKGMTLEQVQKIMGSQGQKNLIKSNLDRNKDKMFKVFWKDSKTLSLLFITIKDGKVISKIKS
jgi:uncharacterized lipoprotein YehR (DUF1307 family)